MKNEFSRQISEKSPNTKPHINPSIDSPVVQCGRTDRPTDRQTDILQLVVLGTRLKVASLQYSVWRNRRYRESAL